MTTIEVFADIACPWCYIGERRLKRVLEARGVEAELRWRPYELQRSMPREGMPWGDFVERKFGGWARARPMFAQVQAAGAGEGIRFDFENVASAPNTRDAHRVILLAEKHGKGPEAAEALFAAYFTEGRNVGDAGVLGEIAASIGLDADEVREMLAGDRFVADVEESEAIAERGHRRAALRLRRALRHLRRPAGAGLRRHARPRDRRPGGLSSASDVQ